MGPSVRTLFDLLNCASTIVFALVEVLEISNLARTKMGLQVFMIPTIKPLIEVFSYAHSKRRLHSP